MYLLLGKIITFQDCGLCMCCVRVQAALHNHALLHLVLSCHSHKC